MYECQKCWYCTSYYLEKPFSRVNLNTQQDVDSDDLLLSFQIDNACCCVALLLTVLLTYSLVGSHLTLSKSQRCSLLPTELLLSYSLLFSLARCCSLVCSVLLSLLSYVALFSPQSALSLAGSCFLLPIELFSSPYSAFLSSPQYMFSSTRNTALSPTVLSSQLRLPSLCLSRLACLVHVGNSISGRFFFCSSLIKHHFEHVFWSCSPKTVFLVLRQQLRKLVKDRVSKFKSSRTASREEDAG